MAGAASKLPFKVGSTVRAESARGAVMRGKVKAIREEDSGTWVDVRSIEDKNVVKAYRPRALVTLQR